MNTQRHEIIHLIISLRHTGEHTSNTLLLLSFGNSLIAKVGRAIRCRGFVFLERGIGGGKGTDESLRAS